MVGKSGQPGPKAEKSTQNTLLISEIKDGVVIMRDGSIRGVLMGSAVNFDLMSPQEQAGVEYAYQGFINSLHFPVQIVVKSVKIDLTEYLDKLSKLRSEQSNELLGILMDDYVANIKTMVEEVNIMDKQFYVVVPFFPPMMEQKSNSLIDNLKAAFESTPDITVQEEDFRQYKQELSHRMSLVANGMTQMGIRALSLGTQELVDLYYAWYNPEVAANQKLIDATQLQTPVVLKGEGAAPKPGAPR